LFSVTPESFTAPAGSPLKVTSSAFAVKVNLISRDIGDIPEAVAFQLRRAADGGQTGTIGERGETFELHPVSAESHIESLCFRVVFPGPAIWPASKFASNVSSVNCRARKVAWRTENLQRLAGEDGPGPNRRSATHAHVLREAII
jgi:hypothetical protein